MKCNLNIAIIFKNYPCTYNKIVLKIWWNQKLGADCANQKKNPIPSVSLFFSNQTNDF